MSATNTAPSLPYAPEIAQLVEDHRRLDDAKLCMALAYVPDRDPGDVFLLEVLDPFGGDASSERTLYEVQFGGAQTGWAGFGGKLHLILTDADGWRLACSEEWAHVQEIRGAAARSLLTVIHDPEGLSAHLGLAHD